MIKKLIILVCFLIFGWTAGAEEIRFEDLSLEEKLGQMLTVFVDVDSAEIFRPVIESGKVGGVLIQWGNYSLAQTKDLVTKLQSWAAKSPHKIPLLISIDYEGGTVYTPITLGFDYLPTNMMFAASSDEEGTATIAYLAGLELKRAGIHVNFSPVLDVNSNPHNPIIGVRSFGSDPANVTKMGLSLMNGFKAAGIVSVVKHFPGHGDTAVDSHYQVPVVKASYQELEKTHIAPFAQAVQHGVQGVMTSHIIYPALDNKNIATFSKPIVQDLLKEQLNFQGLVVTDSLDMKAATQFCTIANCAVRAINTGSDMILLGRYIKPQTTFAQIYKQISANKKSVELVNKSAEKIFNLKKQLGLLDGSFTAPPPIDKAYRAELEKMSNRAVTLVRDRVSLLPFNPEVLRGKKPTVCAIFFSPARFADQLPSFAKPFMEKGWTVRGYNAALTPKAVDAKRARECANGADLLVVTSLQWADKTNINQKNTINALFKENPRNVFISTMSPYDIANYPEVNTVLATYGLNKYVLKTAADIILGNVKPQGKLPVALPVTQ